MLKVQIALIAILIVSVAFVSCERTQKMLAPVADDMMAADDMMTGDDMPTDMMMDMMKMLDPTMYMSWAHGASSTRAHGRSHEPDRDGCGTQSSPRGNWRYNLTDLLYQRYRCHGEQGRNNVSRWDGDCQGNYG